MPGDGLTRDAFLDGRVMLHQPAKGYRAGVDPVFLAAACPAVSGDSVLELGCGVGTAALCLHARVPGLRLTGIERQAEIAAIARDNARAMGATMDVVSADLGALPPEIRQQSFDQVIANPPYFTRDNSLASGHKAREAAMGEDTPLDIWLDVAARRLRPKGWLTMIQRPERLDDMLAGLRGRLGSVQVLPLVPRTGRDCSLILLRARKDGRAPLRLLSPFVLHNGPRHESDKEDYTPLARDVLRAGKAISLFEN